MEIDGHLSVSPRTLSRPESPREVHVIYIRTNPGEPVRMHVPLLSQNLGIKTGTRQIRASREAPPA